MSDTSKRPWLLVALMLVVTAVVASTTIRIEWYNHAVGGFLPRPQPPSVEGNDVKWRTTSADMAEKTYRRMIAYERGVDITEESIEYLIYTGIQQREADRIRRQASLHASFREVVSSFGLIQYLLVPAGFFISVVVFTRHSKMIKFFAILCVGLNLIAGGLMVYREYLPSLGW